MPAVSPQVRVPYLLLDQYLDFIIDNRLNIEVYFDANTLDSIDVADVLAMAAKLTHKPTVTVHGPFMDLSPAAVDKHIREVTRRRFMQVMQLSSPLEPSIIVLHSDYYEWKFNRDVNIWLESSLKFWPEIIEAAAGHGHEMKIALENIFEHNPDNLAMLMKELGSDRFGICFDAGHCNLFTDVPMQSWIDALGDYIIELHLHDNLGDSDAHMPMGKGDVDFKTLLDAFKGREIIHTVEATSKEDAAISISWLRDFYSSD